MNGESPIMNTATVLAKRFDALSLRERLLAFATMLAVAFALWYGALMQPLSDRAEANRTEIEKLTKSTANANSALEDQVLQMAGSGNEQQAKLADAHKRLGEIDAMLAEHATQLIDPGEMAQMLEEVLSERTHLRLIRIRNLNPEKLSTADEENPVTLYRHGLEIEVEGNFLACLDYLTDIEALPWRLYWQAFDLSVLSYPQNRIRIEVSTLSLTEEWIGA